MTNRTWERLTPWQRAGVVAALVVPCCGGVALVGFFADDDPTASFQDGPPAVEASAESPALEPDATFRPVHPQLQTRSRPVVEKRAVTLAEPIAFRTNRMLDGALPKGVRQERVAGVAGERELTYEITVVNGREVARKLLGSRVVRPPVARVVAVGTYEEPACAPGYTPCVPVAADVDCVGVGDDGPAFVTGPVRVTGSDPYDLDHDGDGTACDG